MRSATWLMIGQIVRREARLSGPKRPQERVVISFSNAGDRADRRAASASGPSSIQTMAEEGCPL